WLPAGRVPLLKDLLSQPALSAPIPEGDPANAVPADVLQYSSPNVEMFTVTARALEMLRKTRPWVRFISILMMVFAGLMLLMGIFIAAAANRGAPPAAFGAIYVVMAAFYVAPAIYLGRYASRITGVLRLRRADLLEQALEAQKSFW